MCANVLRFQREPKLKTVHDKKRRPRESTGRSQERHDQDHDSLILHPISPFKINDDDNMRSSLSVKHLPSVVYPYVKLHCGLFKELLKHASISCIGNTYDQFL